MIDRPAWMFDDLSDPVALDASDESDGWYTPSALIDLARRTLGAIDLDPASCEAAQSVVQAGRWYSKVENGLIQPWYGRVWCNPPYSAPTPWARKAIAAYRAGDVTAALILTNSYTETGWWQELAAAGTMLMFRGRQQFWHPNKESGNNRTGQTLCYLGPTPERFREVFGHLGIIARPI